MAMLIRVLLEEIFGLDFEAVFFHSDTLLLEAVLIVIELFFFGMISIRGIKAAALVQTIGAITLLTGIVIMLIAAAFTTEQGMVAFTPSTSPNVSFYQSFMSVFLITPWAFVGFDSLSKVTRELSLPVRKVGKIMIIAIMCGTFAYIANILITLLGMPAQFGTWTEYLESLEGLPGIEGFPVALAARKAMGKAGTCIFFASCISATLTGLVGFFTSISRLINQMAEDDILPGALGKISPKYNSPVNAISTVVILALLISLMRDSFDFIEEVASVGTSLGFGLVAFSTFLNARRRKEKRFAWIGLIGVVLCICFLAFMLIPFPGFDNAMTFKSYYLLMIWIFLGIAVYSFFTRSREDLDIEL